MDFPHPELARGRRGSGVADWGKPTTEYAKLAVSKIAPESFIVERGARCGGGKERRGVMRTCWSVVFTPLCGELPDWEGWECSSGRSLGKSCYWLVV